jgi:transposase InsO family protein
MDIQPKDYGEEVAIFRALLLAPVLNRDLSHGELAAGLRGISEQRVRPPRADSTRTYSVPTLERWLYSYRAEGLPGLRPELRSDRGFAQEIEPDLRGLLLDIRREHPSASVPLILGTLIDEGRLEQGVISEPTVRRLYVQHGLQRRAATPESESKTRLRWQTVSPNALWHGDVCHLTGCTIAGKPTPIRIHGMLDDASRYVIALEAHTTEKEVDMLGMLVDALRRHGKPDALYLDNGATYRGEILATACTRLQVALLHAQPYDPQARGKMERFWRTLREGCLNFITSAGSLTELNAILGAFLDKRYHNAPHAGLLGKCPAKVYAQKATPLAVDEKALRAALTERTRRRVSNDNVISIDGVAWELDQGYLAGKVVTVVRCFVALDEPPWVDHEGKHLLLRRLDPNNNAHRRRPPRNGTAASKPSHAVDFDPSRPLKNKGSKGGNKPEGGAR